VVPYGEIKLYNDGDDDGDDSDDSLTTKVRAETANLWLCNHLSIEL